MKTIYEEFNCDNIQELYEKVKSNDESVKQLTSFIEFSKITFKLNKHIDLKNTKQDILKYVSNIDIPSFFETKVLFLNTKNIPVYLGKYNENLSSQNEVLYYAVLSGATKYYSFNNPLFEKNINDKFNKIAKEYNLIEKENIIKTGKNQYYFEFTNKTYVYDGEIIKTNFDNKFLNNNIQFLKEYNDFMQLYARKEVKGLNIFKNKEKINQILKLGYQDDYLENSSILTIDKKGNILDLHNISLSTVNKVFTPINDLYDKININKNTKGIIQFHNHPSGDINPSSIDIVATKKINQFCKSIKIDLLDSYIIGKQGVYSLKDNYPENFSKLKYVNKPLFSKSSEKEDINNLKLFTSYISKESNITEDKVRNTINSNSEIYIPLKDTTITDTYYNIKENKLTYFDNEEITKYYQNFNEFIEDKFDLER